MWRLLDRKPLQERNYDARVDALAERLRNMKPKPMEQYSTVECEARLETLMGGLNDLAYRLDAEFAQAAEEVALPLRSSAGRKHASRRAGCPMQAPKTRTTRRPA